MSWWVSTQITISNMPFHMKSVQTYWKVLNMEMNLWELAIHLNILNTMKNCQRICSDYIFTMVCHVWHLVAFGSCKVLSNCAAS